MRTGLTKPSLMPSGTELPATASLVMQVELAPPGPALETLPLLSVAKANRVEAPQPAGTTPMYAPVRGSQSVVGFDTKSNCPGFVKKSELIEGFPMRYCWVRPV